MVVLGFPIKDLKMELVVARHNRHHHTTHYTPIHWSKLEVRDLSNIHNVWYPTTALSFTFVRENIPHKLIARKLRQIPALREYAANIKPNRMRDLGLIQYHRNDWRLCMVASNSRVLAEYTSTSSDPNWKDNVSALNWPYLIQLIIGKVLAYEMVLPITMIELGHMSQDELYSLQVRSRIASIRVSIPKWRDARRKER